MNIAISQIASNVGMEFELIITLLIAVGGLIFYAMDFKLGMVLHFVGFGVTFMAFYHYGLNYSKPLICFFMSLVLMALTLYFVSKTTKTRGAIV
jgi:accessory gene regulator protein AgrB